MFVARRGVRTGGEYSNLPPLHATQGQTNQRAWTKLAAGLPCRSFKDLPSWQARILAPGMHVPVIMMAAVCCHERALSDAYRLAHGCTFAAAC
eukprot:1161952-Pelagomonas_calceolata.AAC.1